MLEFIGGVVTGVVMSAIWVAWAGYRALDKVYPNITPNSD